jgi:RNA polymerase sigma factor (sigma-70 family)
MVEDAGSRVEAMTSAEFVAVYDQHSRSVYGYIARRLGPNLAADLTAQTFTEAWAGRHRYDPARGAVLPWLLGIATNLVRRQYRTEARQLKAYASTGIDPVSSFDEDAVIERADSAERLQQVAAALAELDQLDRDLLFLFAALNLSYQQVADALGMPLGSVKSRMSRARERLEARLALGVGGGGRT